ncbi:radical SAM protein [Candidatus Bathyarchaeota archaeon]|nr:radical SAM protein [Candidatus Bathyarchaeota archaeon]
MITVTLVYPYFHPRFDNSIFRFPPIGLGYIAAFLQQHNISVEIVDCTFLDEKQAVDKIIKNKPAIIGIQSMYSMREPALELARLLRPHCGLLVAGGALPTINPEMFLVDFDVVVQGEGEQTMLELVNQFISGGAFDEIKGIAFKDKATGEIKRTASRPLIENLDSLPFPSRELFDNSSYKKYYNRRFGYKTTAILTSRGCPFNCDFCSKPIFGSTVRTRSPIKIVDEVEAVVSLGYDRIWFADDCFTLEKSRLMEVCDKIIDRGVRVKWECLSRVDTLDLEIANKMKQAGCLRVFFGIESGNDYILKIMKKQITTKQAANAIKICKKTGIKAGAFFIVGYPGENYRTIQDTVKLASSLPLDYLSFTLPYPIPGTPLFERIKGDLELDEWQEPKNIKLIKHKLLFDSEITESWLKSIIVKGLVQFRIRKYLGEKGYTIVGAPFERITDVLLTRDKEFDEPMRGELEK